MSRPKKATSRCNLERHIKIPFICICILLSRVPEEKNEHFDGFENFGQKWMLSLRPAITEDVMQIEWAITCGDLSAFGWREQQMPSFPIWLTVWHLDVYHMCISSVRCGFGRFKRRNVVMFVKYELCIIMCIRRLQINRICTVKYRLS